MSTSAGTPGITIVGLGPGDPGLITRAAWQTIESAAPLYLRTAVHPTVAALPPHVELRPFDHLYDTADDFAGIYATIAATLVERAAAGEPVVYAVPGDALVAEATTRHLLALARARGVAVRLIGGVSFVEPVCAALGVDPLAHGMQLIDALDLAPGDAPADSPSWADLHGFAYDRPVLPFPIVPTRPALICQVYSRAVASHAKLTLMERYPAEHQVALVRAAGVPGAEEVVRLPLAELDRGAPIDHLTCVYVPPLAPLADLRGADGAAYVIARLLGPGGCPWDREQSPQSLRGALLEEAHEALEALDAGDDAALADELGDLVLAVLMQAEMARQAGRFDLGDVYAALTAKLIRRHPHVFGDVEAAGSGEVLANWEAIKRDERAAKGEQPRGALDGIPAGLPALATAQKVVGRAVRAGFDAPEVERAWALVDEELAELRQAAGLEGDARAAAIEAELGDLLLALAKLAHKLDVDAESALRAAVGRFRRRFGALERRLAHEGRDLHRLSVAEKEALWEATRPPDD